MGSAPLDDNKPEVEDGINVDVRHPRARCWRQGVTDIRWQKLTSRTTFVFLDSFQIQVGAMTHVGGRIATLFVHRWEIILSSTMVRTIEG